MSRKKIEIEIIEGLQYKGCSKCNRLLPLDNFNKDKTIKCGYYGVCKTCNYDSKKLKAKEKYEQDRCNPEFIRKRKEYAILNRNKRNNQLKDRKKRDPSFKMSCLLRSRLNKVLDRKINDKQNTTFGLLGCSIDEFVKYIESKWLPGMNWENHGPTGWHIDHIRPCASFDLSKLEEQAVCFHYKNMQPLWWIDNIVKSDKFYFNSHITSEKV